MSVELAANTTVEGSYNVLIEIHHGDGKPPYLQIVEQVKYAAASGRLRPGEPLPSIRQLAERLRVNRNTVDKAYRELVHQGVAESERGRGVFLSGQGPQLDEDGCRQVLAEAVDALLVKAHHFRVGCEELLELVQRRHENFAVKRQHLDQRQEEA